jgi:hypothetical protein
MALKGLIQNGEPTNVDVSSPWLLDIYPPPPPKKVSQARIPFDGKAKKLWHYGILQHLWHLKPRISNMGL